MNEVLFKKVKNSERSLGSGELATLISGAGTISRQDVQRMTGNIVRSDLAKMVKAGTIKTLQSNAMSKTAPESYYYTKAFDLKRAGMVNLLSYGVYALRQFKNIGMVSINEGGNGMAQLKLTDELYVPLMLVVADGQSYERKLYERDSQAEQLCIVVDGTALFKQLTKNNLIKDSIALVVDDTPEGKIIRCFYITQYQKGKLITNDFDWSMLKTDKSSAVVDAIDSGYVKAQLARQRSQLPNVSK